MFDQYPTKKTQESTKRARIGLFAMAGLMLIASGAQAYTVTVNLGPSAENFVEHGLGPDISTGRGTYALDQGACLFDGTNTTCTLSGSFTGTTPGYTEGTYTFVTAYAGTGLSPIRAISTASDPDFFTYTAASLSTSMTLNLNTTGGDHFVEPLLTGGYYVPGVGFYFTPSGTYACSGVAVANCTPANVGLVDGAIGQSSVTTVASFEAELPLPATLYLFATAFGLLGRWTRGRSS